MAKAQNFVLRINVPIRLFRMGKGLKTVCNFLITSNPSWMLPGFGEFFFLAIKIAPFSKNAVKLEIKVKFHKKNFNFVY